MIFGKRKRELQADVHSAEKEVTKARQRLKTAESQVADPHIRIREANHFAQMLVDSLLDGYGRRG